MGHEILSLKGFINEMKDVSGGPHPRRFCFVLGAGASRTSGIKTGQELVKIWDRELCERNEAASCRRIQFFREIDGKRKAQLWLCDAGISVVKYEPQRGNHNEF